MGESNWNIYDWFSNEKYWLFDLFEWDCRIGNDGSIWNHLPQVEFISLT